MRLLVVGPCRSPHTLDIALAMNERGHTVHLAGISSTREPAPEIAAAGIPFLALTNSWFAPLSLASRARTLRKLFEANQIDVIHAHVLSSDPFVAAVAGLRPLIATAWGSDVLLPTRAAAWRNRYVARHADILTADSPSLLDELISIGAPAERVVLQNWGVDVRRFSPSTARREHLRERLGLPGGRLILSPRSFAPIYNIDTIVSAFSMLAETDPALNLLVKIDDGDPLPFADTPHADRIHRFGHVPTERLIDYYRAADVCVSIPSSDSSPRTVWEALACGCPCVVSKLRWIDGMIESDNDAVVVGPTPLEVASGITRVLDNSAFAESLSRNGRRLVETHQNRDVEMDRLVELYRAARSGRLPTRGGS